MLAFLLRYGIWANELAGTALFHTSALKQKMLFVLRDQSTGIIKISGSLTK